MKGREWKIGLAGTFDIENYGDLLFPIIAEAELTARLGPIKLHRFSYHAKTPPDWPYTVTSVAELPQLVGQLDAMLIGGGFLIHFDKGVAPGYESPTPAIHHPTGYWLTPALMALSNNLPVIWNAPGMHCNEVPAWADPLMNLAFAHSRYIAVRDVPSQTVLACYAELSQIAVVPDTAFAIARLLDDLPLTETRYQHLCEAADLTRPYIIIQATNGLDTVCRFIRNHAQRLQNYRILALPLGPGLGDQADDFGSDLPGLVRLPEWPSPLLLAKLISHAEAVIGNSYHLAITALAAGVPVFTLRDLNAGKYSALLGFETIYPLAKDSEPDADWFMSRLGRTTPSTAVQTALDQLDQHWNQVVAAISAGPVMPSPGRNQFWQSLPGFLEDVATVRAELALRDRSIASFQNSLSWKVTRPLRFFRDKLMGKKKDRK
jgi:hypothetical protein